MWTLLADNPHMTRATPTQRERWISLVAAAAALAALLCGAPDVFTDATDVAGALRIAGLIALAVLVLALLVARDGLRRVVLAPRLLVPLGTALGARALLSALERTAALAPLSRDVLVFDVGALPVHIGPVGVVRALLEWFHAAWSATLVARAVLDDDTSPARALGPAMRWMPRVGVVLLIGWTPMLALRAIEPGLRDVVGADGFPFVLGALAVGWTLATSAVLVAVIEPTLPFAVALSRGWWVSLRGGRWFWAAAAAHVVALGAFVVVSHGGTIDAVGHAVWGGAFADGSAWRDVYLAEAEIPAHASVLGDVLVSASVGLLALLARLETAEHLADAEF